MLRATFLFLLRFLFCQVLGLLVIFFPFSICAYAQGWLEVTPPGFTDIEHFQKFDSELNGYEVYAWGIDAGYRFTARSAPTAITSYIGEICDMDPFPTYTLLVLSSLAKVSDDPPLVLSMYSSVPGCPFIVPHGELFLDSSVSAMTDIGLFPIPDGSPAVVAVKPYLVSSTFVHAWDSLYHSNDGGLSFQGYSKICDSSGISAFLDFLMFHPQIDGFGFAGGAIRSCETGYLFQSTDNGLTWDPILDLPVRSLLFDRSSSAVMYVASDSGLFKSLDSGQDWFRIKQGAFGSIETDVLDPDILYGGSLSGEMWRSTNAGVRWTLYNNSFSHEPIIGLLKDAASDTIIACATDGVFKVYASFVVDVADESQVVPDQFQLDQNYPNPFNPRTDIGFRISDFGFVSLGIYDLLGQEVATLVNEKLAPGSYSAQWDATGQASGVYFYRLSTAGTTLTRKLVLLR